MATAGMGTSRWKARWLVRCRSFAGTWRDLRDDFYPNFRLKQIPQHMFQETISQTRNLRFFLIWSLQKLSGPLLRQYIKKTEQNMGRKSSRGIDQMMLTMNRHDVNRSTSWSVYNPNFSFLDALANTLCQLPVSIDTINKPRIAFAASEGSHDESLFSYLWMLRLNWGETPILKPNILWIDVYFAALAAIDPLKRAEVCSKMT